MKSGFIAAFAALALAAPAAHAASAVYAIHGTADGSLNGVAFSNAGFNFTLLGDTANITNGGGVQKLDPLDSASVTIDGFSAVKLNIPTYLARSTFSKTVVLNGTIGGNLRNLLIWNTATPVDFAHSFGPVGSTGVEVVGNTFSTTGGDLTFHLFTNFDGARPITFSGAVREVATDGVPEPASWALMLVGFGGLGAALRRRRAAAFA